MGEILTYESKIVFPIQEEKMHFPERITISHQPLLPDVCTPAKASNIQQCGEKIRIRFGVCDIAIAQLKRK
ncbi:MAG: hypothetical protein KatS3mg089_0614 [Patescibacteria group bacterium]|nr:MAG: hypothetical protein KatS3mg089_0614 [Patescibacteria group bacterium]